MSAPLPFSQRTTAAVTVFACLFIAEHAKKFTRSNYLLTNALSTDHAQLRRVYHQLCHQDVANQAVKRAAYVATAATIIASLNTTVQSIPITFSNAYDVEQLQSACQMALYTILLAEAAS